MVCSSNVFRHVSTTSLIRVKKTSKSVSSPTEHLLLPNTSLKLQNNLVTHIKPTTVFLKHQSSLSDFMVALNILPKNALTFSVRNSDRDVGTKKEIII